MTSVVLLERTSTKLSSLARNAVVVRSVESSPSNVSALVAFRLLVGMVAIQGLKQRSGCAA